MNDTESERKKRLAVALRTNLRRRKAQAREGLPKAEEPTQAASEAPSD